MPHARPQLHQTTGAPRRRRITSLVGPVVFATGVWCAAGLITVAAGDAGTRLALPASPWWFVVPLLLGAFVRPWREAPGITLPALLTIVPWLPVPVPSVFFLWTGYMAWIPVGLAVVGAGVYAFPSATGVTDTERAGQPWPREALLAGALTLWMCIAVLWAIHPRLPGGDEPHYLVITQSVLQDGDLRIENNHESRDYAGYWGGVLTPDYIQRGVDGEIYSIHAPGVSLLVAPLFHFAGVRGAQVTILALSAVAGAFIWLIGWIATDNRTAAWFGWAAVVGSLTFLVQSVMIFPDAPGATIVAAATVMWLKLRRHRVVSNTQLVVISAALSFLPFLHTRFAILAVAFGVLVLLSIWLDDQRSAADRMKRTAIFVLFPVVGALLWFGYFQIIYGTPNPLVAYGTARETSPWYAPGGSAGLLFDQQFGLFIYTPVLALAVLGWLLPPAPDRRASLVPLAYVALAYLAAVSTYWMWWAGVPATPARLLTCVLPLLAAPVASVWLRGSTMVRTVAAVLLAMSLAIAIVILAVDNGALAWNTRGPHAAWLGGVGAIADLFRAWPSFFWRLTPAVVRTELPFAVHVAAGVAAFGASALMFGRLARRTSRAAGPILCGLWCVPVGLMLASGAGWWFHHADTLAPAESQLRVMRASAGGAVPLTIRPGRVSRRGTSPPSMEVTVPRVNQPDAAAEWAAMENVPRGHYDLRVWSRRPSGGTLSVRVGGSSGLVTQLPIAPVSEQVIRLDLPAGATVLRFAADPAFAAGVDRIALVPRMIMPGPARVVRGVLRTPQIEAVLADHEVYLEDGAFWVRGGSAAHVFLTRQESSLARLSVRVVNGPRANEVTITTADGRPEQIRLGPGEARVIDVALSGEGSAELEIASPEGFRPSDDGESQDSRFLGVRVEF